ncbi:chorismate-binding protein [Angustibacter peucedani]
MPEAFAWFGGRLARGLAEVRRAGTADDAAAVLADVERAGGWWALVGSFEGDLVAARFDEVRPGLLPEPVAPWPGLAGTWTTSLDRDAYEAAVTDVRERVARGDVYQVNVCRVLEHPLPAEADVVALAHRLHRGNPAPHAGVVRLPGLEVVCASPELFLHRDHDVVLTGPIKGTAPTPEGLQPKDVDENVMIVDLARNDLSTVCRPGSVEVTDLLAVEEHPGLVHLVSRVRGRLAPGRTWADLWRATTPPASVTGAPKSSALRAIADLEPVARGPYCGAVGWLDADAGSAELAVGIRTFWTTDDGTDARVLRFGAGAGITWGSDPAGEWDETELKAHRLLGLAATPDRS